MFGDGSLTLREFAMKEPLPLARIHDAVLEFLRNRDDAALFDAQAVNAYVDEARMTQDVDILSTRASAFAEELREHLATQFHIATRTREVAAGKGFRIYQLRQPKNRHLVDVRHVEAFPRSQIIADIRVPTPEELIAQKVMSCAARHANPKSDLDRRDLKMLLLAFPNLKTESGPVLDRLKSNGADERMVQEWRKLVATEFEAADNDEY
jgi:hypothetical protein